MASCCFGYILYDSFALAKQRGIVRAYDILLHHAIVFGNLYFLCYQNALIGGLCVGLAFALELANITLNIRMIKKMSGRNPGNSSSYALGQCRFLLWIAFVISQSHYAVFD